ncbi:glycosyltransferase family 61 protein [Chondrinema litorale]|uniref:glycosyltransferase family 61 protein n=1 Tax=Chondrinema litorale TaxID=2994555 RepID=UPI0025434DEA|nr:glycosyltransferase family 61 protein [Chondrinema litorale]UZR92537.1 glycosyltransferase family 61 protein [Chondrinema litorale]
MLSDNKYKLSLPCNYNYPEDAALFKKSFFKLPKQKVLTLRNALLTHNGLVFKENILPVWKSFYFHNSHFGNQLYRGFLENLVSRYGRNTPPVKLSKKFDYLSIHTPWFNYYHWIEDSLTRLFLLDYNNLEDYVLILPEEYKTVSFVEETLKNFRFKGIEWLSTGQHALIPNLIFPEQRVFCPNYNPSTVLNLQSFFFEKYMVDINSKKGKRIYIGRKNARRIIQNENEVISVLKSFDFEIHYFENSSFKEQIKLISDAIILVSPHGAALTNINFMKKGSKVLELHKRVTNKNDHHSKVYYHLANTLNLKYYHQLCEPVNPEMDFFESDLIVDIKKLNDNILHMIS